jgi:monoterpene epsilon-lactone hydrolase
MPPQPYLPPERAMGQPPSEELVKRRATLDSRTVRRRPDVTVSAALWSGVHTLECRSNQAESTIVYFHGGGYRLGTARAWTGLGQRLAAVCKARVLLVDYRLAPEHPFPAPLHDAVAVLASVLADRSEPVVAAGDSAGGGLAAAAVAAIVRTRGAVPEGLVSLSGWLDLTITSPAYEANAELDAYFSKASAQEAAATYLQGWDPRDPGASPLFAEIAGFPPTLLCASTAEVLLDDTLAFADRLARAHVPVRTILSPGLPHAWPAIDPESGVTSAVLTDIATFMAGLAHRSSRNQPTEE